MKQDPPWWHTNIRCRCTKFHCTTSRKVTVGFPMVSLEFFIDVILPATLWHWG